MLKFLRTFALSVALMLPFAMQAQETVTIGDGTSTTYVTPYNSLWGYSFVEQIYLADEIGTDGNITSIAFNMQSSGSQTNQIEVFMKNVTRETFTGATDYEPVTAGDMVFSGTVTFSTGWTTIELDSPFDYDGSSNLLIAVHEYTSGYSTRYFYYTSAADKVLTHHSDSANPDPYNLGSYSGNKYVSPNRANIELTIEPVGGVTCPKPANLVATDVAGHTATFTWESEVGSYVFEYKKASEEEWIVEEVSEETITLTELDPVTAYNARVKAVCGDDDESSYRSINFTTTVSCPVPTGLAVTVDPEDHSNVTLSWTQPGGAESWQICVNNNMEELIDVDEPTYTFEGLTLEVPYTVKVRAICNEEDSSAWSASVSFEPSEKIVVGVASSSSYILPTMSNYNYSWTQQIYTVAELGEIPCYFVSLDFYNTGSQHTRNLTIYMKSTDKTSFSSASDWEAVSAGDMVFSGEVTFTPNTWTTIPLSVPFSYDGEQNVLLVVDDNNGSYSSGLSCRTFSTTGNQAIYAYDDEINFDPLTADAGEPSWTGVLTEKNQIRILTTSEQPTCFIPTGLSVSNVLSHGAQIAWTENGEAESWIVAYRSATATEFTEVEVSENPYVLTDLLANTNYYVKVRPACEDGSEMWSSEVSFTTLISCPAVTNLHTTSVTPYSATFEWTVGSEEEAWMVYVDGDEDGVMVEEPTFELTDLEPSTAHTVAVKAYCGDEDLSTAVTASCTTMVACPAPINITAVLTVSDPTIATINWVQPSDVTAWQICLNNSTEYIDVEGEPTYNFTGLTPEEPCTVKIRVICGEGDTSAWSAVYTFTPSSKVIVGTPEATFGYLPTYILYNTSLTEQIYTAAELGEAGLIQSFDFNNAGTATQARNITVYMKSTDKSSFTGTSDWVAVSDADMVYTGTYSFAPGWNTIEFTNPFVYDGQSNVILVVDDNTGTWTSSLSFSVFTTSANQALYQYSDSQNNDPTNPSYSGYTANKKNHVRILKEPLEGCIMPIGVTVSEIEGHSAQVSWTSLDEETSAWVVAYKPVYETEFTEVDVTEAPFIMEDLAAGTAYNVKVGTVCEDDEISWSSIVTFSTTILCDAPTAVSVDYDGGSTATVTWTSTAESFNINVNGQVTEDVESPYTIEGLEIATIYNVMVQANCGEELSGWTTPVTFNTVLCTEDQQCDITLALTDDFGDGWNGNAIIVKDVLTNTVLGTFANTSDAEADEAQIYTLAVCDGREIEFSWQSGSYSYEAIYEVTDINLEEIFSGSDAFAEPILYTVNCTVTDCRKPTNLEVSEIGPNSVVLSWTENGASDAWVVAYETATDEEFTEVEAGTNPFTLEGLTPETPYIVKVRPACDDETIKWSATALFTTTELCPAPNNLTVTDTTASTATLHWTAFSDSYNVRYRRLPTGGQGFESGIGDWTNIDADGDGLVWVLASASAGVYHSSGVDLTGNGHNGSDDFIVSGSYSNASGEALTPDNYLVSPQVELGGSISFWASAQDVNYAADHFGVAVSTTGNTDADDFTTIAEWTMTSDGTGIPGAKEASPWGQFTVDLSDYEGMGYVAIRHFNCTDMFILNVDDINIETPSDAEDNPWIEVTSTTNSVFISGLQANTFYEWQVQGICQGEVGDWTSSNIFTTNDGESCNNPTNLTAEATENSITITYGGDAENYEVALVEGSTWTAPAQGTAVSAQTYTFNNLTPATAYTVGVRAICSEELVSGWVYITVNTIDAACEPVTNVVVSDVTMTGATVAWTVADEAQTAWEVNVTGLNYDQTFTATTNPYTLTGLTAGVEYTVKVRAACGGSSYSEWSDAVTFTTGVCEAVSNVIVSNITANSATIAWTAAEGQTSWQLDYGALGHPQGTGTTVVVNTNPFTLTGLEEYTPYDIYVRAICADGVFSDWSVKANFTTLQTEGIEGVNSDLVKLYPNPASTTVTISGISGEATVSVVDMNGRTVYSERANETLTIDLSGYAQGAYFVRISGEQTMAIRKLIVK
jgi:hypothetical protein